MVVKVRNDDVVCQISTRGGSGSAGDLEVGLGFGTIRRRRGKSKTFLFGVKNISFT
jgi:hypothetical protein